MYAGWFQYHSNCLWWQFQRRWKRWSLKILVRSLVVMPSDVSSLVHVSIFSFVPICFLPKLYMIYARQETWWIKQNTKCLWLTFYLIIGPRGRGITETWHGYVTTLAHPYFNYESAPCASCQWPILRVPAVGRLHRLGTLPIVQGRANN